MEGHVKGRDPVLLRLRVGGGLDDRPLGVLVVPLQHLVKERERRRERSGSRRTARRRRLTSSIPMIAELQVTLQERTGCSVIVSSPKIGFLACRGRPFAVQSTWRVFAVCEKESEVRSENDSKGEETYRRDRSPIAEHDPVPRDPSDVSEPNKFLDVLDGVPLRLGDGRAPEQLRVLRVRVVLHPHEDALVFKPSEDGAGVVLLAEHPARRRVRSEVRTIAGRRRLT